MLILQSQVIIYSQDGEPVTIPFTHEVEIKRTWANLTQTARVVIPKKIQYKGEALVSGPRALVRVGAKIEIWLGYAPNLKRRFTGYITRVKPKVPIELECEDGMHKLKQNNWNIPSTKDQRAFTLKSLCQEILQGTEYQDNHQAEDVDLGKLRLVNASTCTVFDEIKQRYGITTYINADNKLITGLAYYPATAQEVLMDFTKNVIEADGLEYRKADDILLQVVVVSITPTEKKGGGYKDSRVKVAVGDSAGDTRTVHVYGQDLAEMKKTGQAWLDKLKYSGYYGSLTTFLEPAVDFGDRVVMQDPYIKERGEGTYLIKEVVIRAGVGGGRQDITLDTRIDLKS